MTPVDEARGDERRRADRADIGLDDGIWSEVHRSDQSSSHAVVTVLGVHGALLRVLEASDHFPVGSSLRLRFQPPGVSEPVHCGCVVRNHVAAFDVGVEFVLIRPHHRRRVADAVVQWRLGVAA